MCNSCIVLRATDAEVGRMCGLIVHLVVDSPRRVGCVIAAIRQVPQQHSAAFGQAMMNLCAMVIEILKDESPLLEVPATAATRPLS